MACVCRCFCMVCHPNRVPKHRRKEGEGCEANDRKKRSNKMNSSSNKFEDRGSKVDGRLEKQRLSIPGLPCVPRIIFAYTGLCHNSLQSSFCFHKKKTPSFPHFFGRRGFLTVLFFLYRLLHRPRNIHAQASRGHHVLAAVALHVPPAVPVRVLCGSARQVSSARRTQVITRLSTSYEAVS